MAGDVTRSLVRARVEFQCPTGDLASCSRGRHKHRSREVVEGAAHALGEHLDVWAAVPVGDCSEVEMSSVRERADNKGQVARTHGNHPLNACRSSMPALDGEAAPDRTARAPVRNGAVTAKLP